MFVRSLGKCCLVLFVLPLLGCSTPCEQLSKKICSELEAAPKICTIARQESKLTDVSQRHCRALLASWPTIGQIQVQALGKRYSRFKKRVQNKLGRQKAMQEFDRAEVKIRMTFRKLYRLSQ